MSDWIDEIRQAIDLHRRGMLLLVDGAILEKLGALVRGLLPHHPTLEVVTNPTQLPSLPDGSVVVYLPRAEHAFWLNVNRPVFARKSLKVVLFSSRDVTEVLAREAVDFYDWIAQRVDCPDGVAEHAVLGIRQALRCRAPGIIYAYGDDLRPDARARIDRFERLFRAALPGRTLQWIDVRVTYAHIVKSIATAGRAWVACDVVGHEDAARFRWALAEAKRKTRAVILVPYYYEDRFWNLSDALESDLDRAAQWLENAGAKHPLRLLAASGLEHSVVMDLVGLLARDYAEDELLAAMLTSPDPGAGLAPLVLRAGMERFPVQGFFMSPHVQRYLGKRTTVRRWFPGKPRRKVEGIVFDEEIAGGGFPLLIDRAPAIEFLLCHYARTAERWLELSKLAFAQGDFDASMTWAWQSLEENESSAAYFWHGLALAELGRINQDHAHSAGPWLRHEALQSLKDAEMDLDADTPAEDILTLYAMLAELNHEFGMADAGWTVERAAMLADAPNARARDLRRVAEVLGARGQPNRAETILMTALGKTREFGERAEIRLGLAKCALAQQRFEEAEALAKSLQNELEAHWHTALEHVQRGVEQLRVEIQFAQQKYPEAITLADAFIRKASSWRIHDAAIDRIPVLAQALARAGRAADATVLLKRMFNLPQTEELGLRFVGLASRDPLLAFVRDPLPQIGIPSESRAYLWGELIQALRVQGQFVEADELERSGPPEATSS